MHRSFWFIGIVVLAACLASACTKTQYRPEYVRTELRPSFTEVQDRSRDYLKRTAIALNTEGGGRFAGEEALFGETLIATIRERANRLELIAPRDSGFPEFLRRPDPFVSPEANFVLSGQARAQGYHYLLQGDVLDVSTSERKTGIWWFRKTRYFMTIAVALDVYDTFTAAKVSSQVQEQTVRIQAGEYEDFLAGMPQPLSAVDGAIVRMARDLGRQAARQMMATPWKTVVTAVDREHVDLAAGEAAGLRVGDRWAVFEGRRIVDGYGGERFIAPGYRVATIRLTAVTASSARARTDDAASIQVGDIAVPIR